MKIVGLGGGSLYFRRVLPDLILSEELSAAAIVLYDIDLKKVEMMADMGRGLAQKAGVNLNIRATDNLADAVDGADFAISSIGGSGAEITQNVYGSYFHNMDIKIPEKYGIYQVIGDTCGPAGMMMGLRSIPAYMQVCREMEKRCPDVIFFNHSNPMAILCRAMHKYTDLNVYGICHGVQHGITCISEILDIPSHEIDCAWVGTNHYYWFTKIYHQGKNVYPELKEQMGKNEFPEGRELSTRLSTIYNYQIVYPEDDHIIEFYPFLTQIENNEELPYQLQKSRENHGYSSHISKLDFKSPDLEVKKEFYINYQSLLDKTELPSRRDNSITGEGVGKIISAIATGKREICIINKENKGIIPNLPETAEVEVEGVTDSTGVRAVEMDKAPLYLKGILEKRFVWHELVADAGVKGDRNLALQALLIDEMAIQPEKADKMLDELLDASRDLLPQFDI